MIRKMKMLLLSVLLGFTMVCTCSIAAEEVVVAASAVKLNQTKVKLYLGESTQLKVKGVLGTVKWVSSNKKVAKVSSTGRITALKIGNATISAMVGEKTLTCKVKVYSRLSVDEKGYQVTDNEDYATFTILNSTDEDVITYEVADPLILDCIWEDWLEGDDVSLFFIPLNDGNTTVKVWLNGNELDSIELEVTCQAGSIEKQLNEWDILIASAIELEPYTLYYPETLEINHIYFSKIFDDVETYQAVILDVSALNYENEQMEYYSVFYYSEEPLKDRPSLQVDSIDSYVNFYHCYYYPEGVLESNELDLKYFKVLNKYYENQDWFKINPATEDIVE